MVARIRYYPYGCIRFEEPLANARANGWLCTGEQWDAAQLCPCLDT